MTMAATLGRTTFSHKESYCNNNWREGEIAFLQPSEAFSKEDYEDFIQTGQIHRGATGHPVIILKRHSPKATHALVLPVSAYGSGPDNDNLPPWEQHKHRFRPTDDFRAFLGSVRPTDKRPHLLLEAGMMPKSKNSWVCVQSVILVPIRTLRFFTKTRIVLRMEQDSLTDLRKHISKRNPGIDNFLNDPRLMLESTQLLNDYTNPVPPCQQAWRFLNHKDIPMSVPSMAGYTEHPTGSSTRSNSIASPTPSLATSPVSAPTQSRWAHSQLRILRPNVSAPSVPPPRASIPGPTKTVSWAIACA